PERTPCSDMAHVRRQGQGAACRPPQLAGARAQDLMTQLLRMGGSRGGDVPGRGAGGAELELLGEGGAETERNAHEDDLDADADADAGGELDRHRLVALHHEVDAGVDG